MSYKSAYPLIALSVAACTTGVANPDGALPDAAADIASGDRPQATCPADVESSKVACNFGVDKSCTTYYGQSLETCGCTCAGFWECDQVVVDCDANFPPADMTDMCLTLAAAVREVRWDGDGGAPDPTQCATLCEPVRPQGYPGAVSCSEVAVDGGNAIECRFSPCGL